MPGWDGFWGQERVAPEVKQCPITNSPPGTSVRSQELVSENLTVLMGDFFLNPPFAYIVAGINSAGPLFAYYWRLIVW